MYSQEAIAQDGAPQGESAPADSADHDAGQNTAPVEVQDDVSLISIILSTFKFLSKTLLKTIYCKQTMRNICVQILGGYGRNSR